MKANTNLTAARTAKKDNKNMDVKQFPIYYNLVRLHVRDGKRGREILCRKGDLELIMKALAECETITEFTRRQRKEYHFNDLYIELLFYGA